MIIVCIIEFVYAVEITIVEAIIATHPTNRRRQIHFCQLGAVLRKGINRQESAIPIHKHNFLQLRAIVEAAITIAQGSAQFTLLRTAADIIHQRRDDDGSNGCFFKGSAADLPQLLRQIQFRDADTAGESLFTDGLQHGILTAKGDQLHGGTAFKGAVTDERCLIVSMEIFQGNTTLKAIVADPFAGVNIRDLQAGTAFKGLGPQELDLIRRTDDLPDHRIACKVRNETQAVRQFDYFNSSAADKVIDHLFHSVRNFQFGKQYTALKGAGFNGQQAFIEYHRLQLDTIFEGAFAHINHLFAQLCNLQLGSVESKVLDVDQGCGQLFDLKAITFHKGSVAHDPQAIRQGDAIQL